MVAVTNMIAAVAGIMAIGAEARLTAGCGKNPGSNGMKTNRLGGQDREYWQHTPTGYNNNEPTPLVVLFHGWGYSGAEWGNGQGFGAVSAVPAANSNGFVMVAPTGLTDSALRGNCNNGGGYCSWNAGGTSRSPGPDGPTCAPAQRYDYCYRDTCGSCDDNCSWTNCNDDVAFVSDLLDQLEDDLCIDTERIYVGGESNGGIMTYELVQDARTARRIAAAVPVISAPHRGFLTGPADGPMPLMSIAGSSDRTIPPGNVNTTDSDSLSSDNWYYMTQKATTDVFAAANGCNTGSNRQAFSTDNGASGQNSVSCLSTPGCTSPAVQCTFNGGHIVPSHIPELMWEFFSKFTLSSRKA
jgi:poly(3-hydroxybutyrate) depolymerase